MSYEPPEDLVLTEWQREMLGDRAEWVEAWFKTLNRAQKTYDAVHGNSNSGSLSERMDQLAMEARRKALAAGKRRLQEAHEAIGFPRTPHSIKPTFTNGQAEGYVPDPWTSIQLEREPEVLFEWSLDRKHWQSVPESGLIEGLPANSQVFFRQRYEHTMGFEKITKDSGDATRTQVDIEVDGWTGNRCQYPNCSRPAARDYCDKHITAL